MASTVARPAVSRYLFFALACVSLLMWSIDSTIVAVALPTMMDSLHTTLALVGWTLTAYTLAQTAVMPLAGKLSESFGRMRVFLLCVVLFTVGSLLCGVAPNIYLLILFRALQALGGGGFMPSAVGIVAREFPDNRDRMIGLFASIFPIGGIIGPNLGGLILQYTTWRFVFLVNVPLGLLILALLASRFRERVDRARPLQVDILGTALFAGGIVALLVAITGLGNDPGYWRAPPFWLLLAASAGLLVAFVLQERHTAEPIMDLDLVTRGPFIAVNAYNFLFGAAAFGFFSFIPYYAVVRYGMSPALSGAVLTPRSILMMVTATAASLFLIRLGYRLPMILGMACVTLSLLLLSAGWQEWTVLGVTVGSFWLMAGMVAFSGIGMGLSAPASNNAALDLLPERASVVTGIRGMFRSVGGVLGIALIVLALELFKDKAAGMQMIFLALAFVLLLTVPLTFLIPNSARTRSLAARAAARAEAEQLAGQVPAGH